MIFAATTPTNRRWCTFNINLYQYCVDIRPIVLLSTGRMGCVWRKSVQQQHAFDRAQSTIVTVRRCTSRSCGVSAASRAIAVVHLVPACCPRLAVRHLSLRFCFCLDSSSSVAYTSGKNRPWKPNGSGCGRKARACTSSVAASKTSNIVCSRSVSSAVARRTPSSSPSASGR